NNVTVGGSGYSEFAEYIKAGKMRAIGVTSEQRLPGVNVPTMKEMGYDVVLGNWRGVYGAPGITAAQRAALAEMVVKATKSASWKEALEQNKWTPALLVGKPFEEFVDNEFAGLRGTMHLAGML
ncbi:MAG TPA: tripartite tricarboxylate transporter substrate-binding protein, partial [Burkholderiaceae bacterium]|nr:tripartite tricarboxylate transporter substrate-binding protein [Burkholderiaceae bacterium]